MSRLPFEAFLALRYLRPRRSFVSVITVISIIGVTLGVAVMIVVISVMSGFDREWHDRILGFNAHLKVFKNDETPLEDFSAIMAKVGANPRVRGVAPFLRGQVMIKTQPTSGNPRIIAPILRGIDPDVEGKVSNLPRSMKEGKFDVSGNGLLIGRDLALGMNLSVGDRVNIYSEAILPEEFTIRGVFDVGFADYNSSIVICSLENMQRLYELGDDQVHGLQVMLSDAFLASQVREELKATLPPGLRVQTWTEETPYIFNALAVEKNMMFYLLFFIMIVAAFGIVNSQITFVVQKTREIGILKALGATNAQVLWIFLSQSVIVGVLGVGVGLGLALLALAYRNGFLHLMNQVTGRELLPSAIYQIYDLPAEIQTGDIVAICGAAFGACLLAGLFPAWKASRLQPVEALRYE
jgi:lipoprotein-releasing system permease protein